MALAVEPTSKQLLAVSSGTEAWRHLEKIFVVYDNVTALNAASVNRRHSTVTHPKIAALIETTHAVIKEEVKKTFIVTKGFHDTREKLQKNRVVVIKGNTGDGKTSTAIQLLHWLIGEQHDRQPVQIHKIEDLDLLAPNSKMITFVDDIFGEKELRVKEVEEWNTRINSVIPRLCGDEQTEANFLVITVRNEVFNYLKKASLKTVFADLNIIDLSSSIYKIAEEKVKLLDLYEPNNFLWTKKEKEEIVNYAPDVGFPQCCWLFRDLLELQKERVQFFEKPFLFLNEALSKLGECPALLFLFLYDGMIKVKDLDPNSKKINETLLEEAFEIDLVESEDDRTTLTYKKKVEFVKKSLDKLLGFLVVKEKQWRHGEVYRFYHDSIYVAVALLYGEKTPIGYIQNCPCKTLSYITTSNTSLNMIVISSDHYTDMRERLLREFVSEENDYGTSIGSLDVWKDRVFVESFLRLLNDGKVYKRAVLNNNVLYKACVWGIEEIVTVLCDAHPHLVHYTDMWRQTPLHVAPWSGNCCMFETVERTVRKSLCRVEDEQHKCETVDGRVVHVSCACAQYMSQLVDDAGRTVLHWCCMNGNREICKFVCERYPALTTIVNKDGDHCLHYIARRTINVDMFTECETHVKQYLESTGQEYDITAIRDIEGKSVLDSTKEYYGGTENNPLYDHLVKVFRSK